MSPRSKNVAKTTFKGVKKLFGGGSSSGAAVGRKRQRAEGLTASVRRGDHLEKEVLEVDSSSEDSVDSVDSDNNVVVRQLGHVQFVPVDPPKPNWRTRTVAGHRYEVNWTNIGPLYWESWKNHVIQPCNRGPISSYPWECHQNYMTWYARNSHVVLVNPERLPIHPSLETLPNCSPINNVIDETSRLLERGLQLDGNNMPDEARSSFERAYNLTRCKYIGRRYSS